MHVAYITTYDPTDVGEWSGTGAHIARALVAQGCELDFVGNLRKKGSFISYLRKLYYHIFRNQDHFMDRQPDIVERFAGQVEQELNSHDLDVLFSPGTIPIAALQNGLPVVFWTDSTFNALIDYHPNFKRLNNETIANGNKHEQAALDRCSLAIYSTQWSANSALQQYQVDPAKVKVVPFGANMPGIGTEQEALKLVQSKDLRSIELLFIGVDWKWKGGEMALKLTEELNRAGLLTRLTIVGCRVPGAVTKNEFTKVLGFVNKSSDEGLELLEQCFRRSHFLVVPSLADCFGLVYCEANAYAVPCVARRTGGVPEVVRDGVNGMTFPPDADVSHYRDFIISCCSNKSNYQEMAMRSYHEFKTRLNWDTAGKEVRRLLDELVSA